MLSLFKKNNHKQHRQDNLFDLLSVDEQAEKNRKLADIISRLDACKSEELNEVACAL